MSNYKFSGICGDASSELTPEHYRRWGYTLGQWVEPGAKFVVGGDIRRSTPPFQGALIEGLCLSGVDCIDLGQLPTPMIHHAKRRLQADACAIVTASHYPAELNGLTWMIGNCPTDLKQAAKLREVATGASLKTTSDRPRTESRTLDISFDYVAWLQESWCNALRSHQHIVIDTMHGCWSGRARRYLHAIFPECLITTLRDVCDPEFRGECPDCAHPERLEKLCETVDRQRAHLGVAFDGDGDRLALVDGHGVLLTAEETAWVLMRSLGPKMRGKAFVYDLKLSDRLPEAARRLGAEPLIERSDPAFLQARMRESDAIFGAQADGHYFFGELGGDEDALCTACRVIAYVSQTGKTLAGLRRRCPPAYMTPDLRFPMAAEKEQVVVDQIRGALAEFPQVTLDGLRVNLPGGWALVHSSDDCPGLTFRFESFDWPSLDSLVREVCTAAPTLGSELWASYERAMGRGE